MSALTLPGDIPGLLRRCSPVMYLDERRVCSDAPSRQYVIVTGETMCDDGPEWSEPLLSAVALDLTDATGRSHAAWWLAGKFPTCGWPKHDVRWAMFAASCNEKHNRIWHLTGYGCAPFRDAYDSPFSGVVPALSGLDPADPRLLADGSRWVDAEALRLVCLHVAGRDQ